MKYVVLFVGHLYKPFRTIWVDRVGRGGQGRSKSAPEWPESGFGAVQRPLNGSMTPEMDPKWSPQLPLIDLSPFPDLSKHCSLYISKNINYLILPKISISEILTFTASNDQTILFGGDFWILRYHENHNSLKHENIHCIIFPSPCNKINCKSFNVFR